MHTRRSFLQKCLAAGLGFGLLAKTMPAADAPVVLEENDPTAQALGYKADATKVDAKKYPQYQAGQKCLGCALFTGKPGEARGACGAFAGKLVSAGGWCMVYAKKP